MSEIEVKIMDEVQEIEIAVAGRVKIKAGTLEVDVTPGGIGKVLLDGIRVDCRRLVIEMEVGAVVKATVTADVIPIPSRHKTGALGETYKRD